jgi:hypothetical protein
MRPEQSSQILLTPPLVGEGLAEHGLLPELGARQERWMNRCGTGPMEELGQQGVDDFWVRKGIR